MEIKKFRIDIWLDAVLTFGNRPTAPECDREGVVLYGLTLNVNDVDDQFN